MLITFQETPEEPLCTIELPDNLRSIRIASVVRLLVAWGRLQSTFVPENLRETLMQLEGEPREQSRELSRAIERLIELVEKRKRLREEMWAMLAPYLTQNDTTDTRSVSTAEGTDDSIDTVL
ncbi:hypothetical protein V5O48_017447 [Marasmius crinis-equi]|uniref:Transcriptional regulator n=1 Tax=Marasmius crinis-equi TaxID=585013 RepID=A0ABR3ENZ1_9AGAR